MKLIKARIKEFKCIEDSDDFSIDDVTCLVGKNESGKTAILQALYKLNAEEPHLGKFIDLEYPRRKWQPNTEVDQLPVDVLTTTWRIEEDDRAAIKNHFGIDFLKCDTFVVTKGYDNVSRWMITIDEPALVKFALGNANLSAIDANPVRDASSIKAIIEALKNQSKATENQSIFLATLNKTFKRGNANLAVIDVLSSRLPKFVYFSDYYVLPGQVALTDFKQREVRNELEAGDYVFKALLTLAGTTPEAIEDITTFDRLHASIDAVSNRLSDEVFHYWSQNSYLEVRFTFDAARKNDPPPLNTGFVFRTNIRNTRHRATVNFDERSSGFTWFFSFLVWFSQAQENYGDNLIILLDEPALNLHARAQADLLEYIKTRLMPYYQVIYTTHSPFMIDPDNLLKTRTVEDVVRKQRDESGREREVLLGTKVSEDILAVDRDTISPLQAAVGYDITRTLFISKHTLLVEGPSDLIYIEWFSHLLRECGRTALDKRWAICPVGGIDKVASFASLFGGNRLNIAVLVDLHAGQKAKITRLKESALLKSGRVLTADMFVAQTEADIEDILGRETYIALVNRCYGLKGQSVIADDSALSRVLDLVKDRMKVVTQEGVPDFDHFSPAVYLTSHAGELQKELPGLDDAKERFEVIFKTLNSFLP